MPPSPTTLTPGDRLALGALEATDEQAIVDYLDGYRRRRNPAPATYYRRFVLKQWRCERQLSPEQPVFCGWPAGLCKRTSWPM
jgi:hypothetical protein